ncbi:MAG TPA: hypothetical protein VN736_16915 [Candidatus Limnocylindrales bacterium]|nr:hypothetical protein [Candidatus Limnocylindrales bacterium]
MPKNFSVAALKEPRVFMRALIGALLVANLAAAVIAFKPFGGSAADMQQQAVTLQGQLAQLQSRLATSRKLVEKVQVAREQGDAFLAKYFMDRKTTSSLAASELVRTATAAGVKMGPGTFNYTAIEGSNDLQMYTINAGFEGTYANLIKFIDLLDKSPLFLIIEDMQTAGVQNGEMITVQLKIDTFVKDVPGAEL